MKGMGDFSTNMALVLAGTRKTKAPGYWRRFIVTWLARQTDLIDRLDVAGPGFVNISIKPYVWQSLIPIDHRRSRRPSADARSAMIRRVMVEFVSANPTGPLSIGHGRQAILGDSDCPPP